MSDFRFACPHCRQRIAGDSHYRGQGITCPACGKTFTVPAPAAKNAPPRAESSQANPKELSKLALLSVVCSCALGVGSIPAIVLGHLAKARIRRSASIKGKHLANVGLTAGYACLFVTVVLLATGFVALRSKLGRQLSAQQQTATTTNLLAKRLLDAVKIGDPESEGEHLFRGRYSGSGLYLDRNVRDAAFGGFISYTMKVDSQKPATLRCSYWGNDNGGRRFDVVVNGKVVATQTLQFNDPGHFFDVEYDIPPEITRGQTNVSVLFQAYPGKTAGGIYGCQMLLRE